MTPLKNRVLFPNGKSVIELENLEHFLDVGISTSNLIILEGNSELSEFNSISDSPLEIFTEDYQWELSTEWNIPDHYKYHLDVDEYVFSLLETELESGVDANSRIERILTELESFKSHQMMPLIRTIIYIIDKFKSSGVIWGTGRGSSCSSYVLYLIGLHTVDCVKYDIDFNDFVKNH